MDLSPTFRRTQFSLVHSGLITTEINWLGHPTLALHAAIIADVWKTMPFAALLILAGLQTIPDDLYRAARVDGATAAQTFWHITLPWLVPAVSITVMFRTLDALRVFDVVYVLTGGGPANTTETLSIYTYRSVISDTRVRLRCSLGGGDLRDYSRSESLITVPTATRKRRKIRKPDEQTT